MDESEHDGSSNPVEQAEHHRRMRDDWHNLIEDLIQDGQEKGIFDDLPGRGKPLNLRKNPFAADMELANNLLKQNDLAPAWIMERNDIMARTEALRADIQRTWARHQQHFQYIQDQGQRGALTISWDDACLKWEAEIVQLNKRIDSFNLKRPANRLELFKLVLERELARVEAPRWLR